MILLEENFEDVQMIVEASDNGKKKLYMQGVMSEAGRQNRNGRIYSIDDLRRVEQQINEAARLNRHILGECDHPQSLDIKLENVSHRLMEARMQGNQLMFKAEVLSETPKGAILRALLDSGVQIGVSTRGSGQVQESSGQVSNFRFVTLDAVAHPSCQSSYPETLREHLELYNRGEIITDISESMIHDPIAQKYFAIEMKRFIENLSK